MLEVRWLKSHHQYAYTKGNVCQLKKEVAGKLIEGGYVEKFTRPKASKKEKAIK